MRDLCQRAARVAVNLVIVVVGGVVRQVRLECRSVPDELLDGRAVEDGADPDRGPQREFFTARVSRYFRLPTAPIAGRL